MVGQTLSHYVITSELGRGGMGVVYRARDQLLNRDVALKLLREDAVNWADRRVRILAEARAASALNHPAIATIYDVGESGEHIFIVMELVRGRTIRAHLSSDGPIEPHALVRLAAQISAALDAAHSHGIIHGDIKPENIMLQDSGAPKLFDFGIARQTAEEAATITRSVLDVREVPGAKIAGTLAYMPPEILRGEPGDIRSDLYSLGVVLFELVAGQKPFLGPTSTSLIAQIMHEAAPRLGGVGSEMPQELARIVQKLLEKEPGSRYQSARELHVDLNNLQRDLELGAFLPTAAIGKRSVAVLPFKLLTPNPEDEYLGVAIADAIINHLGGSGEVVVRPINSVQRYTKQAMDPLLAAREMNVQIVVDGSIQKSGSRLRVHVQAWNAADGTTLLTCKYDSEMAALFELQDKVGVALGRSLGLTAPVSTQSALEPPTKNQKAYELFLRAIERLSRVNKWDMRTAIEMLEDATRLDPRFADAWARLSEACVFMAGTFDPTPQWYKKGEHAMRRALALDPTNPQAHCAHGRVLWTPLKGYRNRQALLALRESLRRSPGYYPALAWQCLIFIHVGMLDEAIEGLRTVLAAEPDDGFSLTFLGQAIMFKGDFDESEKCFKRALALDPASLWANLFSPMLPLYGENPEDAVGLLENAQHFFPGDALLTGWEGLLWARRDEPRKAERCIQKALKVGVSVLHTHHMWHAAAATYAILGKPQLAVPLLTRAANNGLPNYPVFRDDRYFRSMHSYGPFVRLLAKVKKEGDRYREEFGSS